MTNTEMDAIQVQDTPVLLKRTLSPGLKLLCERLVETTDRAGTGSDSHERLGHFPNFLRARACHEHPRRVLRQCGVRSGYTGQTLAYGSGLRGLWAP